MKKLSNRIVWVVVALNVIFAAAVLLVFVRVGSEPSTLITCWFGFTTGELWFLASIKKTKVKKGGESHDMGSNQKETDQP